MLSIIVIGRNEREHLRRLVSSFQFLRDKWNDVQTIFVDSASKDGTYEHAIELFDECYRLEESDYLCASAGRAVGTEKATQEWLLYLDADMEVCPEFFSEVDLTTKCNENVGYIGKYVNIFDDNHTQITRFKSGNGNGIARRIGGAVLLRREKVLRAGNWNPSLFSHEEDELYSRLKISNNSIQFIDIPMVKHYTEKRGKVSTLIYILFPWGGMGKKYYGMGQVLAAKTKNREIMAYIKFDPFSFLYWSGIIFSILLIIFGDLVSGSIILTATVFLYFIKNGFSDLLIRSAEIPQIITGWFKYNDKYRPKIVDQFNRLTDILNH